MLLSVPSQGTIVLSLPPLPVGANFLVLERNILTLKNNLNQPILDPSGKVQPDPTGWLEWKKDLLGETKVADSGLLTSNYYFYRLRSENQYGVSSPSVYVFSNAENKVSVDGVFLYLEKGNVTNISNELGYFSHHSVGIIIPNISTAIYEVDEIEVWVSKRNGQNDNKIFSKIVPGTPLLSNSTITFEAERCVIYNFKMRMGNNGNFSPFGEELEVNLISTSSTIVIELPSANQILSGKSLLRVKASDINGIRDIEALINGYNLRN